MSDQQPPSCRDRYRVHPGIAPIAAALVLAALTLACPPASGVPGAAAEGLPAATAPAPDRAARDAELADLARRLAAGLPAAEPRAGAPAPPAPPPPAGDPPALSPIERTPLGAGAKPNASGGGTTVGGGGMGGWVQTVLALGAVLALIFIARGIFSRWSGRSAVPTASPVVEVLARASLAPRSSVLVVKLANRILVLGESPQGLTALAEIAEPEEVAELLAAVSAGRAGSASGNFQEMVRGLNSSQAEDMDLTGGDRGEYRIDQAREQVSGLASRLRTLARGGMR